MECKESTILKILDGHTDKIKAVSWSEMHALQQVAPWIIPAIIWDLVRGEKLVKLTGHLTDVNTVAFDPDDSFWRPLVEIEP